MKKRLVIWSSFDNYEIYRPQLVLEEIKGNIEIVAVIFLDENVVKTVDGYLVIKVEELLEIPFDYIVGFGNEIFDDMLRILQMLRVPREKILPGRIFNLPSFDFKRYIQVINEKVSIISDNCWGGLTYHSLGMPFYSPFINLFVEKDDTIKLMQNLKQYLEQPLEFVEIAFDKNRNANYPVCRLDDVRIYCNHYDSFEVAKVAWDRRKSQINWDNILIKMLIEEETQIEEFKKIPYRKIGFSKIPCKEANVLDLSDVIKSDYFKEKYEGRFWELVNWQARSDKVDLKYYDILKLLLGEEDYRRAGL